MALKVAVQMDPLESINIAGDSTFALMLAATARGHSLFHYTPHDLSYRAGRVVARARPVTVQRVVGDHHAFGDPVELDLGADIDAVLMRQDPPFDMAYVTATYLLETIHPSTLVVNDPAEVRSAPEKLLVTRFPDLTPPTLISSDPVQLGDFHRRHGEVVLKPLHGAAGSGVVRLKADDPNLDALIEIHAMGSRDPLVIQKFIPAVSKGDNRILLVDGEPKAGVTLWVEDRDTPVSAGPYRDEQAARCANQIAHLLNGAEQGVAIMVASMPVKKSPRSIRRGDAVALGAAVQRWAKSGTGKISRSSMDNTNTPISNIITDKNTGL